MAYAIMRFEKIKSLAGIQKYQYHAAHREKIPTLQHPEYSACNRAGCPPKWRGYDTIIERYKAAAGSVQIRRNAVMALEFVFAFGEEAEPDIDLTKWMQCNIDFLKKNFGGVNNILDIRLDLDETRPHAHALVIPLDKDKLAANHYIDGKRRCAALQDAYAQECAVLGLEHGVSRLQHPEKPKHYYVPPRDYWRDQAKIQKDAEKAESD